jgi:hypothetical protein
MTWSGSAYCGLVKRQFNEKPVPNTDTDHGWVRHFGLAEEIASQVHLQSGIHSRCAVSAYNGRTN